MQTNLQKQALILVAFIVALSFCALPASAQTFKTNETFDFKTICITTTDDYCDAGTSCNFTLLSPQDEAVISNGLMTDNTYFHNYTIDASNLTSTGTYNYFIICSGSAFSISDSFEVTNTGLALPGDNLTIFMILATIAVIGGMIYLLFYTIQYGLLADVDLKLLSMNLISYMALFVLLFANQTYIGDTLAKTMLNLWISVGAMNNVVIPIILFAFSFFKAKGLHKYLKNERLG